MIKGTAEPPKKNYEGMSLGQLLGIAKKEKRDAEEKKQLEEEEKE